MNSKGQATMESVLMMFVIFAVWIAITTTLRHAHFFQTVFGTPWERLTNTMEFGVPTTQRNTYSKLHPTSYKRHSTLVNP